MSEVRALPKQAVSASEEAPTKTPSSSSILDIARHIARDHSSMFPALTRMTEGVPTQISGLPDKEVFSTPDLARGDKKRREIWLTRRRNNLPMLLQLQSPPDIIVPPPVTDLERGEKSGDAPTEVAPPLITAA